MTWKAIRTKRSAGRSTFQSERRSPTCSRREASCASCWLILHRSGCHDRTKFRRVSEEVGAGIQRAAGPRTAVERGGERGGKSSVTAVAGANGVALPAPAPAALAPATATPAYQLATVQHLSDAEALLTSFRQRSTTDQQMDAQLGTWARQL